MPETLYEALTRDDLLSVLTTGEKSFAPVVHAKAFGAKGNGVNDDTAAIQAAIDYALTVVPENERARVLLGAGVFRTTDTLHLGTNANFSSVTLEGEGYKYRAATGFQFGGTAIVPDFHDRPCINFQGARGSILKGLSIQGKMGYNGYYGLNGLATYDGAADGLDDTLLSTWDDPDLGGADLDKRYAPYAAITIDAYAGLPQGIDGADSYPNGEYATVPNGGKFSSDVLLEDVSIEGFTVGLALQPCDADGNADFVTLRRCGIGWCKWGISIGNSQSRNVALEQCKFALTHTFLTSRRHGRQNGKFGGVISDLSGGASINLFDLHTTAVSGPITFLNLYLEAQWRLGTCTTTTSAEAAITFIGGALAFDQANHKRGWPTSCIDGGQQPTLFKFIGTSFHNYKGVISIQQKSAEFEGCIFTPGDDARPNRYEKLANNAIVGGLITFLFQRPKSSSFQHRAFDTTSSSPEPENLESISPVSFANRKYCIPYYATSATARNDASETPFYVPPRLRTFDKQNLTSAVLVNRVLTVKATGFADDYLVTHYGPLPGDVIYDDPSGSVFFVSARTGDTVTAILQNNYRPVDPVAYAIQETADKVRDGSGWPLNPALAPTLAVTHFNTFNNRPAALGPPGDPAAAGLGVLYVVNSRFYTPTGYTLGTLTAASDTITVVGDDTGANSWVTTDILVDDWMYVDQVIDNWISVVNSKIAAVTAATIQLSANIGKSARKRLDLFIRKPPANV